MIKRWKVCWTQRHEAIVEGCDEDSAWAEAAVIDPEKTTVSESLEEVKELEPRELTKQERDGALSDALYEQERAEE